MTQPLVFTPFFEGDKLSPVKPALLSLQLGNVSQQSPDGRESLVYMWSLFTKCRESIEEGPRLENLSWRLWYEDLRIAGNLSHHGGAEVGSSSSSATGCSFDTDSDSDTDLDNDQAPEVPGHLIRSSTGVSPVREEAGQDATHGGPERVPHGSVVRESHTAAGSQWRRPSPSTSSRRSSYPTSASASRPNAPVASTSAASPKSKKERRAFSFALPRSDSKSTDVQVAPRIRSQSQLTPGSIQRIIEAVLPMDFKTSPPIPTRPTDTIISSAESEHTGHVATHTPSRSQRPATAAGGHLTHPIPKRTTSPLQQQTTAASLSSESLLTASTDNSSLPIDAVFSPQTPSILASDAASSQTSTSHRTSGSVDSTDSTASAPVTSAASSMTMRDVSPPRALSQPQRQQERAWTDMPAPGVAESSAVDARLTGIGASGGGILKSSMSSTRLAAGKPSLIRARSSQNGRASRSVLQRTQSAKSVRIIESPTNEDEEPAEPRSGPSRTVAGTGGAPTKRIPSSSRLQQSHMKNTSTSSLHSSKSGNSSNASVASAVPNSGIANSRLSRDANIALSAEPTKSHALDKGKSRSTRTSAGHSTPSPASLAWQPEANEPAAAASWGTESGSSFVDPQPWLVSAHLGNVQQRTDDVTSSTTPGHAVGPAAAVPTAAPANANGKKKSMFFLCSPTTDSDEESFGASGAARKKAVPPTTVGSPLAVPTIVTSAQSERPVAKATKGKGAAQPSKSAAPVGSDDDDDGFEDEDEEDDSDWSSETSESEEDERMVAIRNEEARQKDLFAKRIPSQMNIAGGGGLLSQLLHPEEYGRGSANLPSHLRNNRSAIELTRARPSGHLQGLDRVGDQARKGTVTVTGMHASKSTAALSGMPRGAPLGPSRSGNGLTRLGGKPVDVELESDSDSDSDDAVGGQNGAAGDTGSGGSNGKITPSQTERFVNLMQRTKSSGQICRGNPPPPVSAPSVAAPAPVQVQGATAFTPRTTRRNMLATELTESLRVNLIMERQSRNRGAMGGLGGVMQAFGNRLAGAKGQPQSQQQARLPQVQKGAGDFAQARVDTAVPPFTTVPTRRVNDVPPPPTTVRRNSDPPVAQHDYYSPGFHHTGW